MTVAQQLPLETWRGLPRCSRATLPGEDGSLSINCLRDVSKPVRAGNKTALRAPGGGLPEALRPKERPARQRSGLVATEEW